MEPKFRVKCELNRDAYRALIQYQAKRTPSLMAVCAAVILVCAMLLWQEGDSDAWIFLLLGMVFLLLGLFWTRLMTWLSWRGGNPAAGENEYGFGEENFTVVNRFEASRIQYAGLMKMVETDGYFLLYVQKAAAHILPKAAFTEGNVQDFAAFLEEKTGKKFLRARSF